MLAGDGSFGITRWRWWGGDAVHPDRAGGSQEIAAAPPGARSGGGHRGLVYQFHRIRLGKGLTCPSDGYVRHYAVSGYGGVVNWQQPAALSVVVATALLFAWRPLRRWLGPRRFDFQRDTGCHCGGGSTRRSNLPVVRVSGRRGERPRTEIR